MQAGAMLHRELGIKSGKILKGVCRSGIDALTAYVIAVDEMIEPNAESEALT